jgi:hypothetical protein
MDKGLWMRFWQSHTDNRKYNTCPFDILRADSELR